MPLSRIKSKMEVSQLRLDSSAASTDENERVLLDGTDAADTNDGYAVILEDLTANPISSVTQADLADNVVGNAPAFRVHLAADQSSITDNAYTKISLDTLIFDSHGYFSTATSKFTPLVAGYYFIIAQVRENQGVDNQSMGAAIYKNGVIASFAGPTAGGASNLDLQFTNAQCSDIIYMNGFDDYLEMYIYINTEDDGTGTVDGGYYQTWMSGVLVSRTS